MQAGAYVSVEGYRGIAFYVDKVSEIDETAQCHMVGDNRSFTFAFDELKEIEREEFCGECGQIGCSHDGTNRSN